MIKFLYMSKQLEEYSREELIQTIQQLRLRKTFGLVWEDKPEQVEEDCQTKLPVLREVPERAIGSGEPDTLVIEGDNYHSLSTLSYTHAGKIDVIYIDPPYNTKNKEFIYNDHYVDAEDRFRHSKWLSFMSKRLLLAKDLLAKDGVILASIDDNEQAQLKLLMDSIFGAENFIDTLAVELSGTSGMKVGAAKRGQIVKNNEFIHIYAKSSLYTEKTRTPLFDPVSGYDTHYSFWLENGKMENLSLVLARSEVVVRALAAFDVAPKKGEFSVKLLDEYIDKSKELKKFIYDNSERIVRTYSAVPKIDPSLVLVENEYVEYKTTKRRYFLSRDSKGQVIQLVPLAMSMRLADDRLGTFGRSVIRGDFWKGFSIDMGNIAKEGGVEFKNGKKPVRLIQQLLKWAVGSNKDAHVLDFFAGSGTTAHAVAQLNQADNGHRKTIICTNNENNIAETVTHRRLQNIAGDYDLSVRYFQTDFVDVAGTADQTRLALVDRCEALVRFREGTFKSIISQPNFKLYGCDSHYAALILDPQKIDDCIRKIESHDLTKPVHIYIFSYSAYAYDDDIPETELDYTTCPIPESILEVYKRIFSERDHLNV